MVTDMSVRNAILGDPTFTFIFTSNIISSRHVEYFICIYTFIHQPRLSIAVDTTPHATHTNYHQSLTLQPRCSRIDLHNQQPATTTTTTKWYPPPSLLCATSSTTPFITSSSTSSSWSRSTSSTSPSPRPCSTSGTCRECTKSWCPVW